MSRTRMTPSSLTAHVGLTRAGPVTVESMKSAPAWMVAKRVPSKVIEPEPEDEIIDLKSIIRDKPEVDVVRDYFRHAVEDLAQSEESYSD